MKLSTEKVLLLFFLCLVINGFGQKSVRYKWNEFPKNPSVKTLQDLQTFYEEDKHTENWEMEQRLVFLNKGLDAAVQLNAEPQIVFSTLD
ncbi:MAG: hypothetical protein HC803_04280 [Saprospiraceae bacterium]|nr:hypothetical protein [Saprospiraceae bacterium]